MKLIAPGRICSRLLAETRAVISISLMSLSLLNAGVCDAQTRETDGQGAYTAEVVQIDGTKKTIRYFRDVRGVIISPDVIDGKLVDGSDAPDNAVEARIAQRKILVKYDKNAQLRLALVSKEDILWKADKFLKDIILIEKRGVMISKEELLNGFYSAFILDAALENEGLKHIISGLEAIASIQMKMSDSELADIKRDARSKAFDKWKSITGSMIVVPAPSK